MAIFLPFTHWLPVRTDQMVFGRPKRVGMPKTKKKKVEVAQTTSTMEVDSVTTGELPQSPLREAQPPQRAAAPPSPGKPLRLQAGREVKEAGKLLKWALMQQKNAESKYATEGRVHEAKCKLLEAKKITSSAAERMEGAYDLLNGVSNADRRYLLAVAAVHEAQLDAAAARISAQAAQIALLELQIARFKRLQRVRRKRR